MQFNVQNACEAKAAQEPNISGEGPLTLEIDKHYCTKHSKALKHSTLRTEAFNLSNTREPDQQRAFYTSHKQLFTRGKGHEGLKH